MRSLCLILLFSIVFFKGFFGAAYAQKINPETFDNKAKAYSILSAQYSRDAYYFARKSYFTTQIRVIKNNADSGIILCKEAIEYANMALKMACDTCDEAIERIKIAKQNQQLAINQFNRVKDAGPKTILAYSQPVIYSTGNALNDAYYASMLFESKSVEKPVKDENVKLKKFPREITRLESDEFSFMTIQEIYGVRLIEIEDEITMLNDEKKNANEKSKAKISMAIGELKEEEKVLMEKMKDSEDRLVKVRNDLSEEMLTIVHNDIFTTEKKGFYNNEVPIPVNQELPNGLVYRIQIGFFKNQLKSDHFDGIFPLSSEKVDNNYYRYVAGNFSKYEDAKVAKHEVIEKGYSDSFVISYYNQKKIPIGEALKLEKDK